VGLDRCVRGTASGATAAGCLNADVAAGEANLITRLKSEFRFARLWPWIEKSATRRFAFAAAMGGLAALLHWSIFPITQARITFIFFIPAIVLATTIAGRWPGALVAVMGIVNSALMKAPGAIWTPNSAEQLTLISSAAVSVMVILVGDYYRSLSRRELSDLHELHELSATLASIPNLPDQLQLILATFVRMHAGSGGLVTIHDPGRDAVEVAACVGFGVPALDQLRSIDAGARGAHSRLIIDDTERDTVEPGLRKVAREQGFRALHATPLIGGDGQVLGALSVHLARPRRPSEREIRIADICARKASVFLARARAEEGVRQRDRRFQAVLEASGVPFLIWSPVRNENGRIVDFRFRYHNTAAAQVMRIRAGEFVGRNVLEVMPHAWDDPGRLQMYVEALEQNEVRHAERQSAADGNLAWFHIVASPLDGDLAVWFADVTQRKAQERALVEADRRKDEFLATLAHELRNPLAPIRQAASIARSEHATDAQKRWSNNVIERQVQHMSLLLDDLLDVSRITHGTLQLRKQDTDLQSVLSAAIETARPLIDERYHQLLIDVPADLMVFGDPLRLAQVLSNLLTNAAKYTNPRGTIRVTADERGGELFMRVEDSGIGIASEDLARVFGMFAHLGSAQDHAGGGLGIGLALAKGIVDLHGGSIEAASGGPGKGSCFTVRMPGASRAAVAAPAHDVVRDGRPVCSRILLADDNRDAAESLAIILRLEGHEVELAHDGATALRIFAQQRPDVALLDIGMPKTNGYEVARQIRANAGGDEVLLIAITGWAQDTDKARSRTAGFDHHLTKPIEPDTLMELLAPRAGP
jgi:PAS domain S-box-containing protein